MERYLKPGGLAAVQVITLPDDRYKAYCEQHSDFIRTYIFPGGHLPSLGTMTAISSRVGLELTGCADIGPDYAVTLRLWRERRMARQDQIRALGYPQVCAPPLLPSPSTPTSLTTLSTLSTLSPTLQRFIRMYEFYFAYCEAGFANGLIHDYQITWKSRTSPPSSRAQNPPPPPPPQQQLVVGLPRRAMRASTHLPLPSY